MRGTEPAEPHRLLSHEDVRTAGLIGLGSVGCGWAATYLALGYDVLAYDPDPEARTRADAFLEATWPMLRDLGLTREPSPPLHRLRLAARSDVASGADIIHENAPESIDLKRETLAQVEAFARPDVLICSSSGGLPPSQIQSGLKTPWRVLVMHPFNPPHLIPLVEVIGGEATATVAVDWAMAFLARLRKHPIRIDREMTAYLTNRLQFALLREAINCVAEGIASPQAIEDAVKYGLGPRWAIMGSLTTLTLAGGPGGMAKTLSSFAPAMDSWFASLGSPRLTPEIQAKLVKASEDIMAGRSAATVIAERDRDLVKLLKALSQD